MDPNRFLRPGAAPAGRLKQIQQAKDMQKAVLERAQRRGSEAPPYRLLELIGKGSFGRVFKRYVESVPLAIVYSYVSEDGTSCGSPVMI